MRINHFPPANPIYSLPFHLQVLYTQGMRVSSNPLIRFLLMGSITVFMSMIHLCLAGWTPPMEPSSSFEVTAQQAFKLSTSLLWVDARSEYDYQSRHIPGAIRLTKEDWDGMLAGFFQQYDGVKPVIVYCNPGCHSSHEIANRLREMGLESVYVLQGGYEAWAKR